MHDPVSQILEDTVAALPWVQSIVLGNPISAWIAAAVTAFVAWIALRTGRWGLARALRRAEHHSGLVGAFGLARSVVVATRGWFLFITALALARPWLELGDDLSRAWAVTVTVALALQIALWLDRLLRAGLDEVVTTRAADDPALLTSFSAVRFLGQVIVWSAVLLLSLDNLGVDVSALVAGFGIGGIAVALAAQNLLGDIFASLSIVMDRPFEVGDFVIVGDYLGVVEKIGLKTTRVRSLGGEQISFGNIDLLSSRIRNYKRMRTRRVAFTLDVVHGTSVDALRSIPTLAREAIERHDDVRFDRANLASIEPTAFRYEFVYYLGTNDYNEYMAVQEAINLDLLSALRDRSIALAHPTYTVHLNGDDHEEGDLAEHSSYAGHAADP